MAVINNKDNRNLLNSQVEENLSDYIARKLIVMLPSTFTAVNSRKLRTFLISQLARFFVIFRVTHVFIYYDPDEKFDSHALGKYVVKVLKYFITPPKFKKLVFPFDFENKDFGIILPAKIRYHVDESYSCEFDFGVIDKKRNLIIYDKFKHQLLGIGKIKNDDLVKKLGYSIRYPQLVVLKRKKLVSYNELNSFSYLGYWPRYFNHGLEQALNYVRENFNAKIIATSRNGDASKNESLLDIIHNTQDLAIVFGSHFRDIFEMRDFKPQDFDFIWNFFFTQEPASIRVEEAIEIALAKLHELKSLLK